MNGNSHDVVILGAVRTAIGKYGGSLKDKPPSELATIVTREAVNRAGIDPSEVDHVVFGHAIHTDTKDMYLSRVAAVNAGIPVLRRQHGTLNRLCGKWSAGYSFCRADDTAGRCENRCGWRG